MTAQFQLQKILPAEVFPDNASYPNPSQFCMIAGVVCLVWVKSRDTENAQKVGKGVERCKMEGNKLYTGSKALLERSVCEKSIVFKIRVEIWL